MTDKIEAIFNRFHELEERMAQPEVAADTSAMEKLAREYRSIERQLPVLTKYMSVLKQHREARDLLSKETDPELVELAREEYETTEKQLPDLEKKVRLVLVPRDPNDAKNAVMEIRAGTGGIEAGIFAADLYRMYSHFCEMKHWKQEILSSSYGDLGSIKEIIFLVNGENTYGTLKFESGVHRVQRVPQTESQGRIHTSAASVAVFPEADEFDITIDPDELRIDVFRSSGPGGQSVNTTDSAVRIVHLPTNLTVTCQDEKSQHKNKAKALKVLKSRLLDQKLEEKEAEETANRRSMVGSGDRSAKIRTYNFPQGRITDHRINLTLYKLDAVMNGSLQEVIDALAVADVNQRMETGAPAAA